MPVALPGPGWGSRSSKAKRGRCRGRRAIWGRWLCPHSGRPSEHRLPLPVAAGSEQGPATATLLADSPCFSLQGTLEGLEEELLAFFSVTPHSVYTALMDNRYFPTPRALRVVTASAPQSRGWWGLGSQAMLTLRAGVPSSPRPGPAAVHARCCAWVPCAPELPQAAEGLWE